MKLNWFGFLSPLYDVADAGGGGGEGGVPADSATDAVAEPSVIEIPGDDALVKYPGADKPTKFKDIRNFQAQWTREAQRRSEIEKKLAEREAQIQRYEQERQQAARRQSNPQGQNDVFEKLRELPYLDGETAAGVVSQIARDIQLRDQVLYKMAEQMQQMRQQLGGLHETHTNTSFDRKIQGWLTEGGYPAEYADLAKEVYLAYEGDDLDYEFPRIFAARVEQIEKAFEAKRQAALARNRQNKFVPGRGGNAGPNKPLQFKGDESPAQIANDLWETMKETGT